MQDLRNKSLMNIKRKVFKVLERDFKNEKVIFILIMSFLVLISSVNLGLTNEYNKIKMYILSRKDCKKQYPYDED